MSNKNLNTPSLEVINVIKNEMTNAAMLKLLDIVKDLEAYYGMQVTEMISIIDDFINHFHSNEMIKTEIKDEIDYHNKNHEESSVNHLLTRIYEKCRAYDSEAEALHSDLFAMRVCKKFISDIALVIALNQPVRDHKIEVIIKKG